MTDRDDSRFRPDDDQPDDYEVGEDYEPAPPPGGAAAAAPVDLGTPLEPRRATPRRSRRRGRCRNLPYGAVEDAAQPTPARRDVRSGRAPAATRTGPSTVPPGAPAPAPGPVTPASGRAGCSPKAVLLVLAAAALAGMVAGILDDVTGTDSSSDPTPTTPPDIDTAWVVTVADLDPAAADDVEIAIGVDGAFTGLSFVSDPLMLVVGSGRYHEPDALAGIDPADGTVRWTRDLPGVLCGDQAFDGAVACLAPEDGGWVYHRVDITTGEDLATAEAPVRDVVTVHAGPDALVVVGPANPAPHADLTALGLDGELLWTTDLATVDGAEHLFDDLLASDMGRSDAADATMERPRWRDLDDGLMMLWVTPGVAIIDPVAGTVVAHECLRATPAHDRYFCQDEAGINRRDLDGQVVWSLPDLQLAYVTDTSDARPAAVTQRFEVMPIDWETGEVTGPAIHRFRPRTNGFTGTAMGPSAAGDAQAAYLEQDGRVVVRLADDVDEVLWVHDVGEDGDYVDEVLTVGGTTVLDAYTMVGLDADTGEELWQRRNRYGIYTSVHDDAMIAIGFDEVARLELP